jgi:hypothetical protein
MSKSKSTRRLTAKFVAAMAVGLGFTLVGCGSETIDASSSKSEKSTYAKEVNQATKSKRPVVTKSVKSLIAKDTAKE